jgi:hypothetical protein
LIHSSGHPSFKIEKCQKYLKAVLPESMRNYNFFKLVLSASRPSILSIFFTLNLKGMGGGALAYRRKKGAKYLETILIIIVEIDLAKQQM